MSWHNKFNLIIITLIFCTNNYSDANDKFALIKNLTSPKLPSLGEDCYDYKRCDNYTECDIFTCVCKVSHYPYNNKCIYGFKWGETRCKYDTDCTVLDANSECDYKWCYCNNNKGYWSNSSKDKCINHLELSPYLWFLMLIPAALFLWCCIYCYRKRSRPVIIVHSAPQQTVARSVPHPTVENAMIVEARIVNGEVVEATMVEGTSVNGRIVDASMLHMQQSDLQYLQNNKNQLRY